MLINSESLSLINLLPDYIQKWCQPFDLDELVEITLDYGRPMVFRFLDNSEIISSFKIAYSDLNEILENKKLGQFSTDNRAGIESTLHRISQILDRDGNVIGLTLRVGRHIETSIKLIADLLDDETASILFIGVPGSGKSTLLRQSARYLADAVECRVMIVDSSNELAGEGHIPHAAIGSARRMMVSKRSDQPNVMIEAVCNHSPEVIIIDEISRKAEAEACSYIKERGVRLIATAHAANLKGLIANKQINDVIGKVDSAAVKDSNKEDNGNRKFTVERIYDSTFNIIVEIVDFNKVNIYRDPSDSVDKILRGQEVVPEQRFLNSSGEVVTYEAGFISPMAGLRRVLK